MLHRFYADSDGATAIEYALIAGLIALVLITVLGTLGQALIPKYQAAADGLN